MCSSTEDFSTGTSSSVGGAGAALAESPKALSRGAPIVADGSSCSNRLSTASLIWFEYFSNTKVSAFLVAASFKASASIIACSNMSDI